MIKVHNISAVALKPATAHFLYFAGMFCLSIGQTSAAEFRVGVAGPMSGPLAEAGRQYRVAVKLAAENINKNGGLNGDQIVVFSADDKATVSGARKAAAQLLANKIHVVIGHYNSTPTAAVSEAYQKNNVLILAPSAIIGKLTDGKAWNVIRLSPRHDAQANAVSRYLEKKFSGEKSTPGSLAILHDTEAFAKALAKKAEKNLAQAGFAAPITGELPSGTRQTRIIRQQLVARINRSQSSAIYWTGSTSSALPLLAALRATRSRALVVATEAFASPGLATSKNPALLDGLRMPVAPEFVASPTANTILPELRKRLNEDLARERQQETKKKKAAASKQRQSRRSRNRRRRGARQPAPPAAQPVKQAEPGSPAVAAYAAMQLLAQAAERASTSNPRAIAAQLRSGKSFKTVAGPMSFDAKGDRREVLYKMMRWELAEDGKLHVVPE